MLPAAVNMLTAAGMSARCDQAMINHGVCIAAGAVARSGKPFWPAAKKFCAVVKVAKVQG
jgi:hypothetical protein